jgi:hypothetical protein
MGRQRFIYCGIAAAFILSGEVAAQQATGLRPGLDVEEPPPATATTEPQADQPAQVAAQPTTLEVNRPTALEIKPAIEPPPPPRKRQRDDDPYRALGLDLGGLIVFPVMRAGIVASDNPGQDTSERQGDFGARLRPSLGIESDWIRHALTINGSGDFIYYEDLSENDSEDAYADAMLRLDVLRSTTLTLDANYTLSSESGSDSEVPDTAIGNRIDHSFGANAALTHRFGRLSTMLKTGADLRYYGDVKLAGGGEEKNSDREYVEPEVTLRVGYETSPAFQPFVQASYVPRFRFDDRDRNGFDRDSDGYYFTAGVAFDPSPLWSGELGLTYLLRDYADPRLETIDTFGLTGRVTWRPSELTTVNLTLGTHLEETAAAGLSGSRVHDARLGMSHDLREYLTLLGSVGVEYENFQGSDETDLTLRANTGVLWRMNRWLAWTLDYDFIYNDSSLPDSDYYENRITAGIEVRR